MKKKTYEQAQEAVGRLGYKIITSKQDYINTQENICCEKDGLKSWCSVVDILHKGEKATSKRFFSMINPFIDDNIKTYLLSQNNDAEILKIQHITKNKRKRILITIKCSCGTIFTRLWDTAKSAKYGAKCSNCLLKERGKNHRKNKQIALEEFNRLGYKIIGDTSDFVRNVPIEVEDNNGYRGFLSYNKLSAGRSFGVFELRTNKQNYIYNINKWAYNNGIGTKVLDFFDDKPYTSQGLKCKCSCGKEFITSINSFRLGKIRCDECTKIMSRYEYMVDNFLKENQIDHIAEYRIYSCRDILPLPFDFYIVKTQSLIEVDGQGHYFPCNFNQISQEDAQRAYEAIVRHDAIKTAYCKQYGIPLLRIPYWEMDNGFYKQKIMQFIEA